MRKRENQNLCHKIVVVHFIGSFLYSNQNVGFLQKKKNVGLLLLGQTVALYLLFCHVGEGEPGLYIEGNFYCIQSLGHRTHSNFPLLFFCFFRVLIYVVYS